MTMLYPYIHITVIMMATYSEMIAFFPNTLFSKKIKIEQSTSSRQPGSDQSLIGCWQSQITLK